MEVYCKHCRYLKYKTDTIAVFLNYCVAPDNTSRNYIGKKIYKYKPDFTNTNKDCKWYSPKWYKRIF